MIGIQTRKEAIEGGNRSNNKLDMWKNREMEKDKPC